MSTWKVPIHRSSGTIPHYAEEIGLERDRKRAQARLDAGFAADAGAKFYNTEDEWKKIIEQSINHYTYDWVDPFEFDGDFEITSYTRGRSSVTFVLTSISDPRMTCEMMVADFFEMLQNIGTLNNCSVSGRFKTVKKGQNFGVKYLGPKRG